MTVSWSDPDAALARPLEKVFRKGSVLTGLGRMGVVTIGDLLRHYPRRYERWGGELTPIAGLPVGEDVMIFAEIVSAKSVPMKSNPRNKMLMVTVTDGERELPMTFFNARYLETKLVPGSRAFFTGIVGTYKDRPQLTHPKHHMVGRDDSQADALSQVDRLVPVYPSSGKADSMAIEKLVRDVLDGMPELIDPLPVEVRARRGFVSLTRALRAVHRPSEDGEWRGARRRLIYEEAFVLQAALARRRAERGAEPATPRAAPVGGLLDAFDARLPFPLTSGQRAVGEELAEELAATHPMHRLLQGEVGSGKTLVALRAMLTVVDGGGQAALLAPTEVLATQHVRSMTAMLGDLAEAGRLGGADVGTRIALLTGSQTAPSRREALLEAASGQAGIVIGTHALLHEKVQFADLGLVVVDEQHRFGVEQRDALRGKGRSAPHLLVMTATPIPRTVAMTVFGDLETSTLSELPPGRSPIATHVVPLGEKPGWINRTWQRVREEVDGGHQVYVVCPRIGDGKAGDARAGDVGAGDQAEEPEEKQLASAVEMLEILSAHPALASVRIGLLHGRLPVEERERVMRGFAAGEVDVLVATTVIEVGVDVPNATCMVVLDAERFGVSQLHQLRGRVGRGTAAGLCLLVTTAPEDSPGRKRLDAVAATVDGFELARVDLEQRREGDVLGAAQSGRRSSLRLLRVLAHEDVIEEARHDAAEVIAADPTLTAHPALALAISQLLEPAREAFLERG